MNQENKKQVIVAAVLGVVLVVVLAYQYFKMGAPATPSETGAAPGQQAAATPGSANPANTVLAEGEDADIADLTNPNVLKALDEELQSLLVDTKNVEFDYASEKVKRNPFAPTNKISATIGINWEKESLVPENIVLPQELNGVIYDEEKPFAVIDGKLVGIGHEFSRRVFLKRIERDRVLLDVDGQEYPLELMKEQ